MMIIKTKQQHDLTYQLDALSQNIIYSRNAPSVICIINSGILNSYLYLLSIEDMQSEDLRIMHNFHTQIKYLQQIIEEKDIIFKRQLQQLKYPAEDSPEVKQNFIRQLFMMNPDQNIVHQQHLQKFISVLTFKLTFALPKIKQYQHQYKQLENQRNYFLLQNFKNFNKPEVLVKVKKMLKQLTKGSLAKNISSFRQSSSTYECMLLAYYFYIKEGFLEGFQFQTIDRINNQLRKAQQISEEFYLDFCRQLRYITKKQSQLSIIIDSQTNQKIFNALQRNDISEEIKICLSQMVRNLIINGNKKYNMQRLYQIAKDSRNKQIKKAIYESTIFRLDSIEGKQIFEKIIKNNQDLQLNNYLIEKQTIYNIQFTQKNYQKQFKRLPPRNTNSMKNVENYAFRNKLKERYTQAIQQKEIQQQFQTKIQRQTMNQRQNEKAFLHPSFQINQEEKGSDVPSMSGTFVSIMTLYKKYGKIKSNDKIYIQQKFMNKSKKSFTKGLLGQLLIDIMIAKIYSTISQKQALTLQSIQNLINKCIMNQQTFERKYIIDNFIPGYTRKNEQLQQLAKRFQKDASQYTKQYSFLEQNQFSKKIYSLFKDIKNQTDLSKRMSIRKMIDTIKTQGIAAIYHFCCTKQKKTIQSVQSYLLKMVIKQLNEYKTDPLLESQYFKYFLNLCILNQSYLKTEKQLQNLLFNACILQLKNIKAKEICLKYMRNQSLVVEKHEYIFKGDQIEMIMRCITYQKQQQSFKEMLKIITLYLLNSKLKPIWLSSLEMIRQNRHFKNYRKEFYALYYLNTKRQRQINFQYIKVNKIIEIFLKEYQQYSSSNNDQDKDLNYMVLFVIFNISIRQPIPSINLFTSLLGKNIGVHFVEEQLILNSENPSRQDIWVSQIAAHIIINSSRHCQYELEIDINPILKSLSTCNPRTKCLLVNFLQIYSQKVPLSPIYLATLQQHLDEQVLQFKYRLANAYLNILEKVQLQKFNPNQIHQIVFYQKIYLDEENISEKINYRILKLMKTYIQSNKFTQFKNIKTFDILTLFLSTNRLQEVKDSLSILNNYSTKFYIPNEVLQVIDKLIQRKSFLKHEMDELVTIKQTLYDNLIKNENEVTVGQVNLWVQKLLDCENEEKGKEYFKKLDKISKNQEIPQDLFNIIQIERCCLKHSQIIDKELKNKLEKKVLLMSEKGTTLNNNLLMRSNLNQQRLDIIKILHNLSFNQKISKDIITGLLTIYKVENSDEKQKLIAKIIVNTYLDYQQKYILKQQAFMDSVNNPKLLAIALPILLKQNFEENNDRIQDSLNKIIRFYGETNNIRHKQLISFLFIKKNVLSNIVNYCQYFEQQMLFFHQNYTSNLNDNCLQALKQLKDLGFQKSINFLQEQQARKHALEKQRQQRLLIRKKHFNSLKERSLIECIKIEGKQQVEETTLISKQIKKIIQLTHQYPQNSLDQSKIKRDYLYNKFDLLALINKLQDLQQQIGNRDKIQKYLLDSILMISSIHQSYVYEELLIKNTAFVSLVQKFIQSNVVEKQLLQIYLKVIQHQNCQQFKLTFENIMRFLKSSSHPPKMLYLLLLILQKSIANYKIQLKQIISQKQNKQIIVQILENHSRSLIQKIKYISIKNLRALNHYLGNNSTIVSEESDKIQQITFLKKEITFRPSQNEENVIYDMLLKQFILKVSIDDGKRINMHIFWNQNIHKIQSTKERIEILTQLYLNSEDASYQAIHQFLQYFIFNNAFNDQRHAIIKNINVLKIQEDMLAKMLIHSYLFNIDKHIQIEQQKIIKQCYNQTMKDIFSFFTSILSLGQQQAVDVIQKMEKDQISIKQIAQTSKQFTLNHIIAFNIFKKIMNITKNIGSKKAKFQLKELISINLTLYKEQQLTNMVGQLFKSFQQIELDYFIQLFQLISHFQQDKKNYLVTLIKQSIKQCRNNPSLLFALVNKNYFKEITRSSKEIQQLINNLLVNQDSFKDNNDHLKNTLNYINTQTRYQSSFRNLRAINNKQLSKWKDQNFQEWSKIVKNNREYTKDPQFIKEALLIIKTAIYYGTSNKTLKNNQLISCLMMLDNQYAKKQNKGRLLQISTGEGKSTIICAVAIILVLKGFKVDIATTTSILAQRDVKQFGKIYRKFNINVADNIDREIYLNGPKQCYGCEVVYGQVAQFQFDYLRDIYNEYNTLGKQGKKREKKYVIVDEVDSMLIDDSSKIAKISSNIIGIEKLQIIYVLIWQKLLKIRQNILEFQDKYYYFDGRLQQKQGVVSFFYYPQDSAINQKQQEIKDLNKYMNRVHKNFQKLVIKIKLLKTNSRQTIKELLMTVQKEIGKKIKQTNENIKIHVPQNFKEFVKTQFPRWVESAIQAQQFQQNIDYIIENQSISPVDYDNTGKVEYSTHWANGLHQFLQLKHFLKLTPQNLTTNFISNIQYFKLYDNLIGVTGTIGSQICKEVLSKTYSVDIVIIPDHFERRLVQYSSKILQNTVQWSQQIIQSTQYQINKNRGVLIICETIDYCNYLYAKFNQKDSNFKIKLYTMNDKNQEKHINSICKKQIIIATNLAGRGTDIKTDKINDYGGLHVILSFLPKNKRVQLQAKGRAARNGSFGSCQIIINKQLLNFKQKSNQYIYLRDSQQRQKLSKFYQEEKDKIQKKDKIFLEFCTFLKQMRVLLKKKVEQVKIKNSQLQKEIKSSSMKDRLILQNHVLAIQEQWAFFLNSQKFDEQLQNGTITLDKFKENIQQKINRSKLIKNPFCLARNGYVYLIAKFQFINWMKYSTNEYTEMGAFNFLKSIKKDENTVSSWTGLAQISIYLKREEITRKCQTQFGRKFANYKQLAIYCYEKASQLLKNEKGIIQIIQKYSMLSPTQKSLSRQAQSHYKILEYYLWNITSILKQIKKSKKLITIKKKKQAHSILFRQLQRKEQIFDEIEREFFEHTNEIIFHHLNSNNNNQSKQVFKLLKQSLKQKNYDKIDFINFYFKQLNSHEMNFLLLNRQEKQNLSYSNAVEFIKSQKTQKQVKYIIQQINQQKDKVQKDNKNKAITYLKDQKSKSCKYNIRIQHYQTKLQKLIKTCKQTIKCEAINFQEIKSTIQQLVCQSYAIQVLLDFNGGQIKRYFDKFVNEAYHQTTIYLEKNIKCHIEDLFQGDNTNREETVRVEFIKENYQKYDFKQIKKIIFQTKEKQQAIKICENLQDQLFNITFNNFISAFNFDASDIKFNVLIHSIEQETPQAKISIAQEILQAVLHRKSYNFDVHIKQIDKDIMYKLISIKLQEQDIIIKGRKEICDLFPKDSSALPQIYEYMLQGIQYLVLAKQEKALPVKQMMAVGTLAFLEVVAGTILTSSGVFAPIGIPLLLQSIADVVALGLTAKTRQFNRKFYIGMKIASIGSAVGLNYLLKAITSLNVVGGVSLGASLARISEVTGRRTLSFVQMHYLNNIKLRSQQLLKEGSREDNIKRRQFEYKKIISQIISSRIQSYFQSKKQLKSIIHKMMALDSVQESSLWNNKIVRQIRNIIFSTNLQEQFQKLAIRISSKLKSEQRDNFMLSFDKSKHFNDILIRYLQEFQRRVYQIQQSMLGIKDILRKYSKLTQKTISQIYQALLKEPKAVKQYRVRIENQTIGNQPIQYSHQLFDQSTLKIILEINNQSPFLRNYQKYLSENKSRNDIIKSVVQHLSTQFSKLLINKLASVEVSSIITTKNVRQSFDQSQKTTPSYSEKQILIQNEKIQRFLIKQSSKAQISQISLNRYAQLALVKQATPVDILMLLQHFQMKNKLIINQSLNPIIGEGQIHYSRKNNGQFRYRIPEKQKDNSGFSELAELQGTHKVEAIRSLYYNIVMEQRDKLVQFLKSYWYLYGDIEVKCINFKQIIHLYKECPALRQIQKVKGCLCDTILLQVQKRGALLSQTAYFSIYYKQEKEQIRKFVQFIVKNNIEGYYHLNNQKKLIEDNNQEEVDNNNKIVVRLLLEPRDQII